MVLTEKIAKQIGKNLQMLREKRGLTREQLAEVAGVNKTVIGRYETGILLAPLDRIFAIANFLEVPVTSLTGEGDTTMEKIVESKILEYRLEHAYEQIEFFLDHPRNDERHFDENGNILIFVPNEIKYEDGKAFYKVDSENVAGVEVAFRNAKSFVRAVESAEKIALQTQITFLSAFRRVLLLDRE